MTSSIPATALFAALALSIVPAPASAAQQPPDSTVVAQDDTRLPPGPAYSPRGAFFRSMLLPGWGQAYVGAPGRGAVYFGIASGSFLMTYVARRQLLDARAEADWLRDIGAIEPDAETELVLDRERSVEDWAAFSLFVMFLAGADAYVSAYLADFEDRIGVRPAADGSLELRATFPLGRSP